MSQIELQPGFDFQKAGKDVLEIEREGLAQLDQYINQDFSLACAECSLSEYSKEYSECILEY